MSVREPLLIDVNMSTGLPKEMPYIDLYFDEYCKTPLKP